MRAEQSPVALAIDIGGTFTDLAAVDARTGELLLAKADSTPTRLQQGVLSALERSGLEPRDVGAFVHGSTVVINAITERRGARTAVVTTEGFRDVLEIGRANRPDLYNLSYRKPEPFVPRRFRFEVRERISHRGEVLVPLDKVGVERIADHLRADIDAVAICFLHSWINPDHERRTAELLSKLLKGVEIVASHEVSTQWREYERTSTTVLSAYVKPTVADYLTDLRSGLRDAGVASPLYAMRSSGGGADPGPACYGRGGADATVTDANLVAGRLDPNYFLGGTMPLDVGAAHRSLARLGQQLNVDAPSAARGVLRYVVAQMAHALRLVTLRRGHDPRDFTFVAFGGAGPLHPALLARELGVA